MSFTLRQASLIAGTFATVALVAPAQAQDEAKTMFHTRYAELRAGMEARDAAAIGKVMAPEYQVTDIRGETRNGSEMMQRMAQMAARAPDPSRKVETKVLSATIAGDSATVEQQLVASGKRTGDDGEEHTMDMVMTSTDTWAKRGDAWMLVKSVQTGMTVKRDGEVFFSEGKQG